MRDVRFLITNTVYGLPLDEGDRFLDELAGLVAELRQSQECERARSEQASAQIRVGR